MLTDMIRFRAALTGVRGTTFDPRFRFEKIRREELFAILADRT